MTAELRDVKRPGDQSQAATRVSGPGYWWARPAWAIGLLRPGLREATMADSFRLRQLPAVIGTLLLPIVTIGVPLAFSLLHATTTPNEQPIPDLMAVVIHDVFTESLIFMAVALAIGIASPAAGALLVIVFGIGNLAVTAYSGELDPMVDATFGRLVSYGLLWLLVVEIPLLGRLTVEWIINDEGAPIPRRWTAIGFGAAVVALTTFAWAQAAPMLITIVYWTTAAWGNPFLAAVQPLQENGLLLVGVTALAGLLLLAVRYMGPLVVFSPPARRSRLSRLPGGPVLTYLLSVAVALALLSGVISTPIDAAVLVVALLASRPVARLALSATRMAGPLARIPGPIRLLLGFGAAVVVGWVILSAVGAADWSRFSTAVIAIAVGFFVISLFTAADDVVATSARRSEPAPVVTAALGGLFALLLVMLAFPTAALADNCGDLSDCWTDFLRAALAAGGAAVLAAQRFTNNEFNKVLPPSFPVGGPLGPDRPKVPDVPRSDLPPWYKDFLAEHEGPPAPPAPPQQAPAYDPSGIRTGGQSGA